ncbi:hypothetical protein TNCV_759381 [Trichonephila clavipes]|nr:hypothetical protein TNCV_759381 [Trichonephila clavipes]
MTDICHCAQEGMEPQPRLNSDPPSLKAPEGEKWMMCHRNEKFFSKSNDAWLSGKLGKLPPVRRAKGGDVDAPNANKSTERVINGGLFSLRMSPGLASKAILGVFSFGVNLEFIFIHDTLEKEKSRSACVWGGISLCGFTDLHVFSHGNVNAYTYRNDILDAYYEWPYTG